MLFLAAFIAMIAAVVAEYILYKRLAFKQLTYTASFSSAEVTVGDDIYLYEEIRNEGHLPIPCLKADSDLPEGLEFTLIETEAGGKRKISTTRSVQSLFVLHSNARVRRRWRVRAKKRGEYKLGGVIVSVSDILGLNTISRALEPQEGRATSVVVLPLPEPLGGSFASSRYLGGDIISQLCPITDPQRICGSREYTIHDPMNRINWKSTAVHGRLMVNIEEKTVRPRFSVLLNMNSRGIEQRRDTPSTPASVERGITVAASLLDRIAAEDVPTRLIVNAPIVSDGGEECFIKLGDDERGEMGYSVCGSWRGGRQMIDAMRTLAMLPLEISAPPEMMFDHMAASPKLFGENENLIIVSAYIDDRMINFCRVMREHGINVVFYIVTTRNAVGTIPGDIDVFFSL